MYGGGYSAPSNTINNNQKNKLPNKTIEEVVELYADFKINIDKSWSNPRTAKGYTENLNRIAEIFEYISGSTKTPISEYDKESARKIQKILSIIPTNLKKKYPQLTLEQVIKNN